MFPLRIECLRHGHSMVSKKSMTYKKQGRSQNLKAVPQSLMEVF